MEVFVESELAAAQFGTAVHRDARGAQALDLHAQHLHEAAELLHVRLGRRVVERGGAFCRCSAEHEVFGGGDRGVIQPMVHGLERAGALDQQRAERAFDMAAEVAKHFDVRIDLAHAQRAALDVVFEPRHAKAGQQRRHQHDRRTHFFGQMVFGRIEMRVFVVQVERAGVAVPADVTSEHAKDVEDLANVGDVGNAHQLEGFLSEQGCAQDRKHRVLVGGRRDAPAQRHASMHDQIGHGSVDSLQE